MDICHNGTTIVAIKGSKIQYLLNYSCKGQKMLWTSKMRDILRYIGLKINLCRFSHNPGISSC